MKGGIGCSRRRRSRRFGWLGSTLPSVDRPFDFDVDRLVHLFWDPRRAAAVGCCGSGRGRRCECAAGTLWFGSQVVGLLSWLGPCGGRRIGVRVVVRLLWVAGSARWWSPMRAGAPGWCLRGMGGCCCGVLVGVARIVQGGVAWSPGWAVPGARLRRGMGVVTAVGACCIWCCGVVGVGGVGVWSERVVSVVSGRMGRPFRYGARGTNW